MNKLIKKFFILIPVLLYTGFTGFSSSHTETEEFIVDGIKIILKPSEKEVISVRLFIDGGTANYSKEDEGIEAVALDIASTGGTLALPKLVFNNELEKIGTTINSGSSYDYGNISMVCVKGYWDKSWDLFASAVMTPAFDEKEFNITKDQFIAAAMQNESDPDGHLVNLSLQNVFKGKNYSKIPGGSLASLQAMNLQDVKDYYREIMVKKRIFLVIAGDVAKEDISAKVRSSLSALPAGSPAVVEQKILIDEAGEVIEHRDIETNYIRGIFSAPSMSEEDGIPMRLAMSILGTRYFIELRTKRSLSYAPGAFYSTGAIRNPYNVMYISTQKPKESMEVMVNIIEDIKKNGFTEDELKSKKEMFTTSYYLNLMTNEAQTQNLGTSELISDWTLSKEFDNKIQSVSLEELNEIFDRYANTIKWTYLGDESAVSKEDFKQIRKVENIP
jgi:zinc protease